MRIEAVDESNLPHRGVFELLQVAGPTTLHGGLQRRNAAGRAAAQQQQEEKGVHVSRLSAAASEFRAALVEAFVRHSGLIFLVTAIPFGLLFVLYVESGNTPVAPDTVVTPGFLHPLHGLLVLAVYGLAGLVFGLFVWVGIPVLILSFAVWLSKLSE